MSKKTTTKKTSKPSQHKADLFDGYTPFGKEWEKTTMRLPKAKLIPMLRDALKDRANMHLRHLANEVAQLSSKINTLTAWEAMQEALSDHTPAPHAVEPEAPKWVPKVDEVLVLVSNPKLLFKVVHAPDELGFSLTTESLAPPPQQYYGQSVGLYRPATEEEITAFKEAEEERKWAGKTELVDGDACEVTPEQRDEIANEFATITHPGFGKYKDHLNVCWDGESLDSIIPRQDDLNYIPFPVFKRLLSAKVEAMAEEKKRAEWAKVGELQENDAVRCTEEQRIALVASLKDMGLPIAKWFAPGEGGMNNVRWDEWCIIRAYEEAKENNWLPESEFLRRAKGTVEARKKAAEAAELAKPIEFGTRVMYDGIEHLVCIEAPASDGDWLLTRKGENDAWWVPHSEFTIVNG